MMLPSKAKVGDTMHFVFPTGTANAISGFDVTVNGKRIQDPEVVMKRAPGGNTANLVYNVAEPGIYQFVITPIRQDGAKGEPRLHTIEVATDLLGSA
jgi:hypothetical protein